MVGLCLRVPLRVWALRRTANLECIQNDDVPLFPSTLWTSADLDRAGVTPVAEPTRAC